ncbi:hypothetical protein SAMD00019534_079130 [Acytostelium subglobosum LB1]|uniref:hypothetical protein n=1 Tax=Acytostelium subglobosum LB1 TaxID=1410327 RepID=UPI000644D8E7|nr:hypothetical protein SAMD00019534_079130 [Acytostelium subglobosum LB1]GAM24738.1 hypothetical protein SAMD00019534_079130 [Acytostelium subglobosum LB1]|eukprot:XP_012752407.1 hypothetical protein SAMD00019534_079130 [Acytostelium subglobosum LB1]
MFEWATGPEKGLSLYDRNVSKCHGFCRFMTYQPDGHRYDSIHIWANNSWDDWFDSETTFEGTIQGYLLETGGESDPVIIPADCQPSVLNITNLVRFNTANLTVTITNSTLKRSPFQCSEVSHTSTTFACRTQYMVGEYDILITDGVTTYSSRKYHPNLPLITSMFPKYLQGESVTISGINFGDTIQCIDSVTISRTGLIGCIPDVMLIPDRAFTCRLNESIMTDMVNGYVDNSMLPVTISVGGIEMYQVTRIPTYNSLTDTLIMFSADVNEFVSRTSYMAEGVQSQSYSPIKIDEFYSVRNLHLAPFYHYFAQQDQSRQVVVDGNGLNQQLLGPSTPLTLDPQVVNSLGMNLTHQLGWRSDTLEMRDDRAQGHDYAIVSFNFSRPPPFFLDTNIVIPTTGGWAGIRLANMRYTISNYTMLMTNRTLPINVAFTENSTITATFPSGTGINKPLTVYVDKIKTTNFAFLSYQAPALVNITGVSYNGSIATLYGSNFGYNQSLVNVVLQNRTQLQLIQMNQSATDTTARLTFNLPPGDGISDIHVVVDGQASNSVRFDYQRCPDLCSGNGQCISGTCNCTSGYGGSNCNTTVTPSGEVPSTTPTNSTIGEFGIFFTHIRELDSNDQPLITIPVSNIQWSNSITNRATSTNTTKGTLAALPGFTIIVTSQYFNKSTVVEFANKSIPIDANNVKVQTELRSWPFIAKTNTLQLVYQLQSPTQSDRCNKKTTQTSQDSNNVRYIDILVGDRLFVTRFTNFLLVDGRVTLSNNIILKPSDPIFQQDYYVEQPTQVHDRIVVAMVSPHFDNGAILDPNFGMLTAINKADETDQCQGKFKLWWIAVIIGGVIALASICIAVYLVYKKKFRYKQEDKKIEMVANVNNSNRR